MELYSNNISNELKQKSKLFASISLALIPLTLSGILAGYLSPQGSPYTVFLMSVALLSFVIAFLLNKNGKYSLATHLLIYTCVILPIAVLYFKQHNNETAFSTLSWVLLPTLLGSLFFSVNQVIILILFSLISPFMFLLVTDDMEFYSIFKPIFGVYLPMSVIIIISAIMASRYTNKIMEQSATISRSLLEKETLLKEIHHRVKNNLQVITSLLVLQSGVIDDEKTKKVFRNSQIRINTMAMIHEMLYQENDMANINYNKYVHDLAGYLLKTFKGSDHNITLNVDLPEVYFNIDTSIPLGLLINEIISNSLKYAFPDNNGTLSVKIYQQEYPNFIMEIGDDGIGYSDNPEQKNGSSLGLRLINNLSRQLKGSTKKDSSKKGTNYIIAFQEINQLS